MMEAEQQVHNIGLWRHGKPPSTQLRTLLNSAIELFSFTGNGISESVWLEIPKLRKKWLNARRRSKAVMGVGSWKCLFTYWLSFRRGKSVSPSERFELHMLHFLLFWKHKSTQRSDLESCFTAETRAMRSATYRWCEGNFSGSEEFLLNLRFSLPLTSNHSPSETKLLLVLSWSLKSSTLRKAFHGDEDN